MCEGESGIVRDSSVVGVCEGIRRIYIPAVYMIYIMTASGMRGLETATINP